MPSGWAGKSLRFDVAAEVFNGVGWIDGRRAAHAVEVGAIFSGRINWLFTFFIFGRRGVGRGALYSLSAMPESRILFAGLLEVNGAPR